MRSLAACSTLCTAAGVAAPSSYDAHLAVSSWWPEPADNGARLRISICCACSPSGTRHISSRWRKRRSPLQQTRAREYRTSAARQQRAGAPRRGEQPASLWRPERASVAPPTNRILPKLVQRRADAVRPDIVVAMQIQAAPYAAVVPGVPRSLKNWSLLASGLVQHQRDPRRRARNWLTLWKQQRYIRRLLRYFDACTVVSEAERGIVGPIAPAGMPIAVVPNGTDVAAAAQFVAALTALPAGRSPCRHAGVSRRTVLRRQLRRGQLFSGRGFSDHSSSKASRAHRITGTRAGQRAALTGRA